MKTNGKAFWLAVAFFLCLICLACGGDDASGTDITSERIDIKDTEITMEAKETSRTITVNANCQWSASVASGWTGLTVNPSNGSLTISTPVNDTRSDRPAVILVTSQSGKVKRNISITQRSGDARLEVKPQTLSYPGEGDSKEFAIQTNSEWTIAGANDWCQISPSSGSGDATIKVTVLPNQEESPRPTHKLVVNLKNSTIQAEVTINQDAAPTLNVESSKEKVSALQSTITIQVKGTASWRATSNETWAHVSSDAQGTGQGTFTVSCDDNKTPDVRYALITLKWSRETTSPVTVEIEQAAGEYPKVTIQNTASDITRESFVVSASCTSMFSVTRYGFCFTVDKDKTPVVTNDQWTVKQEGVPTEGKFQAKLSGLTSGRTYYVRAFAESEVGVGYSETIAVQTMGDTPNSGDNPTPDFAPKKSLLK